MPPPATLPSPSMSASQSAKSIAQAAKRRQNPTCDICVLIGCAPSHVAPQSSESTPPAPVAAEMHPRPRDDLGPPSTAAAVQAVRASAHTLVCVSVAECPLKAVIPN